MSKNDIFFVDDNRFKMQPRDIFICINGAVTAEAIRIIARLEEVEGWTCWYAERDMPPGYCDNTEIINEMLKKCTMFLLLSSDDAASRQHTQALVSQALAIGKERTEFRLGGERTVDTLCRRLKRLMEHENYISQEGPDYEYEGTSILSLISPRAIMLFIALLAGVLGSAMIFYAIRNAVIVRNEHRARIAAYETYGPAADAILRLPVVSNIVGTTVVPDDFVPIAYSALLGDIDAKYELANMFSDRREHAMAAYWYRLAARHGHLDAQGVMGLLYLNGQGVNRNYDQAMYWYRQAAVQGHEDAQVGLGVLYFMREDFEESVYWYRHAAKQGHVIAQSNLGIFYAIGDGVLQCYTQAAYWFRRAAEQEHVDAMVNIGWMYDAGRGMPQNHRTAAYWYRKAAEYGNPTGQGNIALMYRSGRGVPQCYERAAYWFKRAAVQGCIRGAIYLGLAYELGDGVDKDYDQAIYWYTRVMACPVGSEWLGDRLDILLERHGYAG